MVEVTAKSGSQKEGEAAVDSFRKDLGPFVVATEKTRMPMIFTDQKPGHPIVFANDAFLALTGYERDEVLAKSFHSLLAVGVDAATLPIVEAAFRGESDSDPEIHYKRKDGSEFWASIFISPVCDESGAVVQQFVSFVDLTKHRQENIRCKMLIDELNHRVKNTLSTVQSIVTQALRRPAEPEAIREAIESRLLALSRSHDLLTSGNWEGAGLHDLVDTALHPFEGIAGREERFTIVGDNMHLPPKTALSLAIAFHELATNAVKYGAFSNDAGKIEIDWTVVREVAGDRLVLRWRERDGPPVMPPTRKGFGSWVIERGLAHELGAKVTLDYLNLGLACTIDIPAPAGADE
ncbi:HWE histidine kinase domain-containing protein [Sphingosinicella rhizophila]|uniref:histidine kinase n=1 Tax=Sphingosinicella rhizophila TaxID=3050082 RepID=A0ABU3QCE1_9SPHN|nr:HWE histidine kinase domain-containing protein [Sphingosinicella sp. GR2756]MDT9601070.1 HWE histidine kinase domain-containing protein [Sphingosinicella sp. GR2756]